ncbi:hypothetical protein AB0M39_20705 [Streptomyces sp. NPDC051907]|uniref:hypothetical protein n=1 Tax=Streptomyces sp. NPDC051907 TaxID=3155284 RepID=UPI00343EC1A8
MPTPDQSRQNGLALSSDWRRLVGKWASGHHRPFEADTASLTVDVAHPAAQRDITLTFTTTSNGLLLLLATDDRYLADDQIALAAAAANAWNVERLVPMLSVCNLGGTARPYLAGVRTMPLACEMTQPAFQTMADQWVEDARALFTWCHKECGL